MIDACCLAKKNPLNLQGIFSFMEHNPGDELKTKEY